MTVLDELSARAFARRGADTLGAHLQATYGIDVAGLHPLDTATFRVERRDGPDWVARLHPAARPLARAHEDAAILDGLRGSAFPAERTAVAGPVSEHEGQGVVVTEHVAAVPRGERRDAIVAIGGLTALGVLLARLAARERPDPAFARSGGAWHHLADGPPSAEIGAARAMLADAERLVPSPQRRLSARLGRALEAADDGDGLPEAFLHPDFVLANVVASPGGGITVVDWTGAGRGPRMWALAFLLWAAAGDDPRRIDRVVAGYRREIEPEPEELRRLPGLVLARPAVFEAWTFCTGRRSLEEAAATVRRTRARAGEVAVRAVRAFSSRSPP